MIVSGMIPIRLIISLALTSLVGGMLLRLVISIYNGTAAKLAPNRTNSHEQLQIQPPQTEATTLDLEAAQETTNPYATPPATETPDVLRPAPPLAVPRPSFAKAYFICITAALSSAFVVHALRIWFGMSEIAGREKVIMERLFTVLPIPIALIGSVVACRLMLPTSLGKSIFVSILFGIATCIALPLVAIVVAGLFAVFAN